VQPGSGVVLGDVLVLVVVGAGDLDLADASGRVVPVHLGQQPDLEAPVGRDPDHLGHVEPHRLLTGEGVAEAVEEVEHVVRPEGGAKGADQRGHEESHRPSVHAAEAAAAAAAALTNAVPLEMLAVDVRAALAALAALTGDEVGDDVLDVLFARFCIGK
ncbi:MAG: hypothetical protein KC464_01505, partial [Myxococcales bacterium]|nr:hypothetical protein [Myxococcales bacterium]